MSDQSWWSRRGLATRMTLGFGVLLALVAVMVWLIARAIGPRAFQDRMMRDARHGDMMGRTQDVSEAFRASSGVALAIALAVAFVVAAAVSLAIARRVGGSLAALTGAARRVADGGYEARVPATGMGPEFEDLASSFNDMAERLQESERLRGRLIGDVAHELRTPVATIAGYLDGIEDGVAELTPETVALLRDQTARLTRLAEDLAAVTRAEGGDAVLDRVLVDPVALVRAAHTAALARAQGEGISLEVDAPSSLPRINADPGRMAQVLGNLVDNAIRHTPEGGVVTLSARLAGAHVEVSVADTGEGIAPEHLPHVFERFYRADTARDRASGGAGVGLAIVRALVVAHGGSVRAASDGVGRGALFTVTLPVAV